MLHCALIPSLILLAAVSVVLKLIFALATWSMVTSALSNLDDVSGCLNPHGETVEKLLDERARANARLIQAFNLTNTFVSSDENVHTAFVGQARGLLKQANKDGWLSFRDLSIQAVQFELGRLEECPQISYDIFIQSVCLRVILVGLLGVDASVESFAREDILTVTGHVNKLWSLSKAPQGVPPQLLPELTSSLRRLVPDAERYPNPVDFVIPAWETLWRVVAIAVAYSDQDDHMSNAFLDLYSKPDVRMFNGSTGQEALCAKNIIEETMRVHPPSKHIGRVKLRPFLRRCPSTFIKIADALLPSCVIRCKVSADIAALQRSEGIWGSDASVFNPWRHVLDHGEDSTRPSSADIQAETVKQRRNALRCIFGGGPLQCIGASWAPVAAGILCSAVIAATRHGERVEILRDEKSSIGGRDGWGGWSIQRSNDDCKHEPVDKGSI